MNKTAWTGPFGHPLAFVGIVSDFRDWLNYAFSFESPF